MTQRNKQKRRKAKRKNSNKMAQRPPPPPIRPSWVDQVAFVPVVNTSSSPDTDEHTGVATTTATATTTTATAPSSSSSRATTASSIQLAIVSWNVLAQTYCTRRSHPQLPPASTKVVFNPIKRKKRILEVLEQMAMATNHNHNPSSSYNTTTDDSENHNADDDDDDCDKEQEVEVEVEAISVGDASPSATTPPLHSSGIGNGNADNNNNNNNGGGGVDIFCLQEVDLPEVGRHLRDLGYGGIETPRISGGGSGGRADSCVVYANSKRWQVLGHEIIRLDDLATLSSSSTSSSTSSTSTSSTNFQGLQTSFLRRNGAMLVRLKYIPPTASAGSSAAAAATATTIVVANAHLYWHPGYEYVKLCQTHYILQRARAFLRKTDHGSKNSSEPLILCGDLNSKPYGCCHSYLTHGCINAKIVAPWYNTAASSFVDDEEEDDDEDKESLNKDDNDNDEDDEKLVGEEMSKLTIRDQAEEGNGDTDNDDDTNKGPPPPPHDLSIASCASATRAEAEVAAIKPATVEQQKQEEAPAAPEIRYLLDVTLNRLCRWLRILGIDTALETEQEEQQRTSIVITKGSRQSSRVNETTATTTPSASTTTDNITSTLANGKNGDQEAVAECTDTSKETTATTSSTANGNTQFNLYSSRRVLLFDRCHKERRTLVTTSIRLAHRNDCPPGTYCIHPTSLGNLEVVMVHLLKTHGVVLDPVNKFLSRCVVCNGNILSVGDDLDEKRRILESYDAPLEKLMEANVYECSGCKQGYWWSEDVETYSASRVKDTAKRLFLKCLAGGIPMVQDMDKNTATTAADDNDGTTMTLREYDLGILNDKGINVDAIRRQGWDYSAPGSELLRQELDVIEWLKQEELVCPFQLESAYSRGKSSATSSKDVVDFNANEDDTTGVGVVGMQNGDSDHGGGDGELLPFTNVTAHFVNTLDYIFFERQKFILHDRLFVPTSFRQMNPEAIHNGHLLPSDVWPSDHVAIGARLLLVPEEDPPEPQGEAVPNKSDSMTVQSDDTWMFCAPIAASGQGNCTSAPPPPPPPPPIPTVNHGQRCDCGCVPPILSLFEMAELRKQHRQRKELEKKQQQEQQQQNHP